MVELILGWLLGDGRFVDLLADLGDPLPDLLVGEGLELGLEPVRLIDLWLDPSKLAVVRVDKTIEKAQNHSRGSIGEAALWPRSGACSVAGCRPAAADPGRCGGPSPGENLASTPRVRARMCIQNAVRPN